MSNMGPQVIDLKSGRTSSCTCEIIKVSSLDMSTPNPVWPAPFYLRKNQKYVPVKKRPQKMVMYRPLSNQPSRKSQVEKKALDVTSVLANAAVDQWSNIACINLVTVGAASNGRVGRKIQMVSVNLRYRLFIGGAVGAATRARILVIYDKQANGALPVITDILVNNDFSSMNNLNNSDRFITIADIYTDYPSLNAQIVADQIHRKINLDTMFSVAAGGISDTTSGSLLIMMAPCDTVTTTSIQVRSRVRYTDQ